MYALSVLGLFLDAGVCFAQPNTIHTLLAEVARAPAALGIGPRLSWDGIAEIPPQTRQANPDICDARLLALREAAG